MMGVEEVRDHLIQLEIAQREETNLLGQIRIEATEAIRRQMQLDKAVALRKGEIARARRDLVREEQLAASKAQGEEVMAGQAELIEQFEALSTGHEWKEGIYEHQWHGAMFGAVAKRWILGDDVGLGKTRTAIAWADLNEAKRIIVVTQPDLCDGFAGEVMELAPHRTLTNIYKQLPERRHLLLDKAVSMDEGIIVVNYEMFRRDKDALAKLLGWRADTLIVDEAHNLKNTRTSNFKTIEMIVKCDNVCPNCAEPIKSLYDLEGLRKKPSRKIPTPCESCGWRKGDGGNWSNRLEELLSSRSIKNLLFMTGTPIINEPGDLFATLSLCDPVLFPTRNAFYETYCTKNYHSDRYEFRGGALKNLKPLIEGRFIARTKEDAGIELPEQRVHVIPVDLDKNKYPMQYRTIRQISDAAQIVLDSGSSMTIMHMISLITRKRQANVWPGGIEVRHPETGEIIFSAGEEVQESVKMDAIIENIMAQHSAGKRQVVFSQFKTALAEMEIRLKALGIRVVRLDGSTKPALRTEIKSNFYRAEGEEAKWDVVLANYKTGGTGLNLTSVTVMHIFDEEWSPGKRDQAYGRNNRIGQTEENDVYVYRIPGTIDTWMSNGIHRKELMLNEFNEVLSSKDEEVTLTSFIEAIKNGDML